MDKIELYPNVQPINVNMDLGRGLRPYNFRTHELWHDDAGLVHSISMTFDDGAVGNFILLPRHKSALKVAEAATSVLADWGLSIIAGKIMKSHPKLRSQPEEVHNVGRHLAGAFGRGVLVPNLFEYLSLKDSAYFEVASGELVIPEPIRLPSSGTRRTG